MPSSDVTVWRQKSGVPIDNPYQMQGEYRRVLCVCTAGLLRSPTMAWVLSNPPYNRNTRAAGSHLEFALVPVTRPLLDWADDVIFANEANYVVTLRHFPEGWKRKTFILNVPDQYGYREPELVEAINRELRRVEYEKG